MTDQHSPAPNTTHQDGPAPDAITRPEPPPRPRWVTWLVIAIAVAALAFLGFHLLMGGGHGPMQHMPGMHMGLPAPVAHSTGGTA